MLNNDFHIKYFSARRCPLLSAVKHGRWSTNSTMSYKTHVQLTCDEGYILESGQNTTEITCMSNGQWSANETAFVCQGISIILCVKVIIF